MLEKFDKRLRTANHKARLPTKVDEAVGRRMRMRRKLLDMSQADLAEDLGITHQQVQKYESGTTRLSASRLHQVASVLKVSVAWFFEGVSEDNASLSSTGDGSTCAADVGVPEADSGSVASTSEPNAVRLLRLYYSIPDQGVRDDLIGFLENFAERNR